MMSPVSRAVIVAGLFLAQALQVAAGALASPADATADAHATDPDLLEPTLGSAQSKGCIRIPLRVLPLDQTPVEGAGRYLIVVDSGRERRPPWSPAPLTAPTR